MNIKILVIDDGAEDRKLAQEVLMKGGYNNVLFAETGIEGIEKAKLIKFDFIVMNIKLPDMHGYEVCVHIKSIIGIDVKIIMMSAYGELIDDAELKACNADGAVLKTSDHRLLVQAIKKHS